MMPCVYCIGCESYRRGDRIYCARADRGECVDRAFYASRCEDELYPMHPDKHRPIPREEGKP